MSGPLYDEIRNRYNIAVFEPITKGWSSDQKYYIETKDGTRMLLRGSGIAEYDRKKAEYDMMRRAHALSIRAPRPLGFYLLEGGEYIYSLSEWLEGKDAEAALPFLPDTEQYVIGTKAGSLLAKMHTLPAPEHAEPWGDRFYRKVRGRLDFYSANGIKSEGGDIIVRYLMNNRRLLDSRPQTFNHGDFGPSNLIVMPDGQIGVIDFNYYNSDHGDPWWEFCCIPWGMETSCHFMTGLIKGYFCGTPPRGFFEILSYYYAYDALAALCDTSVGEQGEPEDGRRHLDNVLRWFGNMDEDAPLWYHEDF